MKKRAVLISIAVVLVLAAAIGGTLASFNTESQVGTTNIDLDDLKVALAAKVGDEVDVNYMIKDGVPGQEEELSGYAVTNQLKEEGYSIYTKVVIDKQWSGADKDELDASMIGLFMNDNILNSSSVGKALNDWIVFSADDEQVVMYYTKPLALTEKTTEFLTKIVLDSTMNNAYANKEADVTVTVYAVQEIAADKSIPAEWGVYPTIDENGVITAIEE